MQKPTKLLRSLSTMTHDSATKGSVRAPGFQERIVQVALGAVPEGTRLKESNPAFHEEYTYYSGFWCWSTVSNNNSFQYESVRQHELNLQYIKEGPWIK